MKRTLFVVLAGAAVLGSAALVVPLLLSGTETSEASEIDTRALKKRPRRR